MVPRLTVALLVVVAGCSGIADGPPDQRTAGETPARTASTSTGSPPATERPTTDGMFDCGYTLSVTKASDGDANRIDRTLNYSSLSEERQEEFLEAREEGSTDLGEELSYPWTSPLVVRYNDKSFVTAVVTC